MIPSLVRDLIVDPTRQVLDALYAAETQAPFLWIDWREDDASIAATCDAIVGPGVLAAEWRGDDLFVHGRGREVRVALEQDAGDRHRALVACNEILVPTHEVRFVWETDGADTAGLLLLSAEDWQSLESDYGRKAVAAAYLTLAPYPNIFTDPLHALRPKRPAPPPATRRSWWRFRQRTRNPAAGRQDLRNGSRRPVVAATFHRCHLLNLSRGSLSPSKFDHYAMSDSLERGMLASWATASEVVAVSYPAH